MKPLRVFMYEFHPLRNRAEPKVMDLQDFAAKYPTLSKNVENDSMIESDKLECKYAFFSNRKDAPAFSRMKRFVEDIEAIKEAAFEGEEDF